MKLKKYFIFLFLISNMFYACDSDDLDFQNKYEKSKSVWLEFKESSNNSYEYTVISSSWTGDSWQTTIRVENGIVTQRNFVFSPTEELLAELSDSELKWTETDDEIGTHNNGASPITLDEVYKLAQQEWLIKRNNAETYFKADNNGMISSCGYTDYQCVDDCFRGIRISSISEICYDE